MNRNALYVRILLVLIALVVLLAFLNRSPRPASADTWLPSSYNPVGAGHLAFYETLDRLGWPVSRWREPLSRLFDEGTGNTLIITRSRVGARVAFSDQEIELLQAWVNRGNTLVLLGALGGWDDTRQLLRAFGFTVAPEAAPGAVSDLFHPLETGSGRPMKIAAAPELLSGGTLVLPPSEPLPAAYPSGSWVLAQRDGQPYLLDVPCSHGGHLICGASALLLDNAYLGQGDNLTLVLHLLAPNGQTPRHLFFEESHHGFSAVFALARLLKHPGIRFGGMLALLGLLAFLGSSLVRFGPVVPLQRAEGRSSLEFVDSIADLYQRADLRNDMIGYLFRETHLRILRRLNLPPAAPHDLIASRLQQAYPQLPRWKKLAQRFDSRDYMNGLPPSGWLRVARDLIEIKSAMA
jgi:hypothetical protein